MLRKVQWFGYAINFVGVILMLVAEYSLHSPHRHPAKIVAFVLVFVGSTTQFVAGSKERKTKPQSEADPF